MIMITKKDFDEVADKDMYYVAKRWDYYKYVIEMIERIQPDSVIELGAYKLPLVKDCDVMDIHPYVENTIIQDANDMPWNIDKEYDLFIGLQCMEHFKDPRAVFQEIKRISKSAIISIPYMWKTSSESHNGLNESTLREWSGVEPASQDIVRRRLIAYYKFEE